MEVECTLTKSYLHEMVLVSHELLSQYCIIYFRNNILKLVDKHVYLESLHTADFLLDDCLVGSLISMKMEMDGWYGNAYITTNLIALKLNCWRAIC